MNNAKKLKIVKSIINEVNKNFKKAKLKSNKSKTGVYIDENKVQKHKRNKFNYNLCLVALEYIKRIIDNEKISKEEKKIYEEIMKKEQEIFK